MSTYIERLQRSRDIINKLHKTIEREKNNSESEYKEKVKNYHYTDNEGKSKKYDFDYLYEKCENRLVKHSEFISKLAEKQITSVNRISIQFDVLLSEFLDKIESTFNSYSENPNNYMYEFIYHEDLVDHYSSLIILSSFAEINENIVLIGGNGSGKSSYANAFKGQDRDNISVIPAQKSLYFTLNDPRLLMTRNNDLEKILLENNIYKSKSNEDYQYFDYQNNQFTKLIIGMREQHNSYLYQCQENQIVATNDSIFGKLEQIYKIIFPDIQLKMDPGREVLKCIKSGNEYYINSLSEGEKAVLYYCISVLISKNDSFIIVDEPETYLNPSIANTLWDLLVEVRSDCQFIFITHSVDFVLARNDIYLVWIKNYSHPDKWEFEKVDGNFKLPKNLMTEVLGAKKPIIFCEGENKDSLDYKVYKAIFGNKYTVIPIGGHSEVVKYCEVLSKSEWIGIECKGIIDGDSDYNRDLKHLNITILPFNEIEMLLLSDEIITSLMKKIFDDKAIEKIEKFKEEFFDLNQKKLEQMILMKLTSDINGYISSKCISSNNSIEEIEKSLESISKYDVDGQYKNYKYEFISAIENKDYNSMLKICNLKKEISKGLANRFLDNNFEDKAIAHLKSTKEVKDEMIKKYFTLL